MTYSVRHGTGANYKVEGPFANIGAAMTRRGELFQKSIHSEVRGPKGETVCKRQPKSGRQDCDINDVLNLVGGLRP